MRILVRAAKLDIRLRTAPINSERMIRICRQSCSSLVPALNGLVELAFVLNRNQNRMRAGQGLFAPSDLTLISHYHHKLQHWLDDEAWHYPHKIKVSAMLLNTTLPVSGSQVGPCRHTEGDFVSLVHTRTVLKHGATYSAMR